ncbi:MAG: sulfotransferase family protein [Rhodobacteraceae bacterium]|nr:sulfotransferase family protein [Paracoccaceae bacterium]
MAESAANPVERPAKVFNLGLPKSGTTTLAHSLRQAGYRVADWRVRKLGYVGSVMYYSYFKGLDPLRKLGDFDAFTQMDIVRDGRNFWPQSDYGLLSTIQEFHPDAKFLLSYRDPEKLSESMLRWSDLGRKRLKIHTVPGLPFGYGKKHLHRVKWIEGHYRFCRKVFAGDPNFLEYDIDDPGAPKKIGAFLGRDLPWWGTANASRKDGFKEVELEEARE